MLAHTTWAGYLGIFALAAVATLYKYRYVLIPGVGLGLYLLLR